MIYTEVCEHGGKYNVTNGMCHKCRRITPAHYNALRANKKLTDYDKALYWYKRALLAPHFTIHDKEIFDKRYGSYFNENGAQIRES